MTLLHTINLDNHNILLYDEIDHDLTQRGHISSMVPFLGDTTYCFGLSCDSTCHFHNSQQRFGKSCTEILPELIRSKLLLTHPEYLI